MRAAIARAGSIVSRVLGVNPATFFSTAPLRLEPAFIGAHRFKQTAAQASRTKNERLRGDQAVANRFKMADLLVFAFQNKVQLLAPLGN